MSETLATPITSLITVSVICGIILLLFNSSPLYSVIKTVCSLVVLLTVVSILSPILSEITAIKIENDEQGVPPGLTDEAYETLSLESAKYISIYTEDMISSRFGIPKDSFSVCVTLTEDEDGLKIKNITLDFSDKYTESYPEISKTVSDTFFCECILLTER